MADNPRSIGANEPVLHSRSMRGQNNEVRPDVFRDVENSTADTAHSDLHIHGCFPPKLACEQGQFSLCAVQERLVSQP